MSIHASLRPLRRRLEIVRLREEDSSEAFAEAVRAGFSATPKSLPCRFLYDEAGSELFERICDLPEYYLTRTEDAILRDHAEAMVSGWDEAPAMVELGSGSSTKTRRLIGAAMELHGHLHYLPIDVSPTILEESARSLARDFFRLRVTGYAGDYRVALGSIAGRVRGPKLLVFLGSSLGNYADADAVDLLRCMAKAMGPEDRLLLGTDLAKDRATLEAAYDDSQGVSAAFNRNLLRRINRELGGDLDPEGFVHTAQYRPERGRMEMHLVSLRDQAASVPGAALGRVRFAEGEAIHTEDSHKYTLKMLASLAERGGFAEEAAWLDDAGMFRVQRWRVA